MANGFFTGLAEAVPSLIAGGLNVYSAIETRRAQRHAERSGRAQVRQPRRRPVTAQSLMGRGFFPMEGTSPIAREAQRLMEPAVRGAAAPALTNGATGTWPDLLPMVARGGRWLFEQMSRRVEHPRGLLVRARTPAPMTASGVPFAPPGYNVHYEDEAGTFFISKKRRTNYLNLRALRKAERRVTGFGKIVRKHYKPSKSTFGGYVTRRRRRRKK